MTKRPLLLASLLTALCFVLAAMLELGGTYAVWRWLREGATPLLGAAGAALLVG